MHIGFVTLEDDLVFWQQCRSSFAPSAPDAAPTYRVYGPDANTTMTNGTGTMSSTIDSQTGLCNGTLNCTGANGYASGKNYFIRIRYLVSTAEKVDTYTFTVI